MISKFRRNRVIEEGLDSMFDVDLADIQNLNKYNYGISCLLIMIDVFSHYLWVTPVKTNLGKQSSLHSKMYLNMGEIPKWFDLRRGANSITDMGLLYLSSKNIAVQCTERYRKANYVELVNITLKNMMCRYFTANKTWMCYMIGV